MVNNRPVSRNLENLNFEVKDATRGDAPRREATLTVSLLRGDDDLPVGLFWMICFEILVVLV